MNYLLCSMLGLAAVCSCNIMAARQTPQADDAPQGRELHATGAHYSPPPAPPPNVYNSAKFRTNVLNTEFTATPDQISLLNYTLSNQLTGGWHISRKEHITITKNTDGSITIHANAFHGLSGYNYHDFTFIWDTVTPKCLFTNIN